MKKIRYMAEAAALYLFYGFMRILPVDTASAFGGFLGRTFGPLMGSSETARNNLSRVFPDKTEDEQRGLLKDMWDNLGRVMAEYPHLKTIATKRVKIENEDVMKTALQSGKSVIFTGAHFGNWEIQSIFFMHRYDFPIALTYRAPNNPWVDKLLKRMRPRTEDVDYVAKSRSAGRDLMRTLKDNKHIGVLIDQKNNEGVSVPFFGFPAMTSPAFVQLAQKFDAQIICCRTKRGKGANFTIRVEQPVSIFDESGKPRQTEDVLADIHAIIEGWITEEPAQWLWIHNRWPKSA